METFKNRELRRIFEPKMEAVRGRWIKQHNLYSIPPIIGIIRYLVEKESVCSMYGKEEKCIQISSQ
jgi:hypothetical protein